LSRCPGDTVPTILPTTTFAACPQLDVMAMVVRAATRAWPLHGDASRIEINAKGSPNSIENASDLSVHAGTQDARPQAISIPPVLQREPGADTVGRHARNREAEAAA